MASGVPPARVVRAVELARHHLARLQRRTVPPPIAMMEMVLGAWVAQAITAAANLGIADALADGPLTADQLASAVGADADAISRLLRALETRGIFRQRRDGRYELTPMADTLRSDADVSLSAWAQFMGSPQHREHWSHLPDAIRTGRAVIPDLRGKPFFEYMLDEPEFADLFNGAMTSVSELAISSVIAGYDFSPYATIVDVGGGHGRLLSAILEAAPNSRGILFDLPNVVAGAPVILGKHGVADRVRIAEGSFFNDVPSGGDAYVLKSIIHDWADDDAVRILRNVRRAAAPGANVLLVETVIPRHHREFPGKWVDLEMLLVAASRERTAAEHADLMKLAGFRLTRVVETASPFGVVEAVAI
ncbi:acetylserotonin O-methyltransferase [Mycobacterium paraterrae]|uniref:Acetylserotonin O-methyltransferase n=1 Tax=Mycobacterium paraterrae TaxID=577492 RepID=A0ABY3VMW5_9MYCO|nr:acetylserotonin O-methyltransferase [Mycobacterium paraterrae]UMB70781.1 acetylserotonin O-methyltransferase [Mycobacterium paraterrae]